jgi:hypothetical protein
MMFLGDIRSACPACGADRLVPLSFQVARAGAGDQERPEVIAMRPLAKCGGCAARIYPNRVTHRFDPAESAACVAQRTDSLARQSESVVGNDRTSLSHNCLSTRRR